MKAFRIFLLALIIIGLLMLITQKLWVPKLVNLIIQSEKKDNTPIIPAPAKADKISITTKDIKEENFTGSMPVIIGTSPLAVKMREYVENEIKEFRKLANTDVPDLRKEFGADSPTADYMIGIDSEYIKGKETESIATEIYSYTGGAHGNSSYKVMTADLSSGKIISLSNIIKTDKRTAFVEFVKKQLNNWFDGNEAPVVFSGLVKDLEFDSFENWSLDQENLIIYFDQYAIGPGVLGAVAFPIPLSKISDFLK